MSQNSVSSVILRFALDEQSQRRVLKGVGDIEQVLSQTRRRIVSVEDAAAGMNAEFADLARAKAIDNLSADAIKAATETGDWARELERVSTLLSEIGASDSEIKQVARSLSEAQTTRGGSGSRGGGNVETVDRLGSVGSQLLSGLGQGELANVAGIVGDVAGGIGSLGVAGVAAAGALGAVSIAMGEYNRQLEIQKTALRGALDAQNRYYEAVQNLTTEQAQSEIDNAAATLERLRQQRAETQGAIDSAFAQAQGLFGGDLTARILEGTGQLPTAQLREQLTQLDAQITSTEGFVARLTQGQAANAFAVNDAAAAAEEAAQAEKQLAEERQRFVEEQLRETAAAWDNLTQASVSAQIAVQRLTEVERTERIAEIEREIEILQRVSESTRISSEYADSLNKRIAALSVESMILADATNTLADSAQEAADALKAQEEATALISQQTDNYFAAVTATTQAQEALTKAQQESQKAYTDYIAKSLEISTQTAEKEREILADGGDKRADIERRTQDAIAKTMRDYGREQLNAVAERDALASYQAKQRAEDQLTDEQKSRADAIKEQEKAQAKALASLQASVNQQTRTLETSYRNQQAITANAELRKQIDLQNAKASEVAIAANGANGLRTIMQDTWGNLLKDASSFYSQMSQLSGAAFGAGSKLTTSPAFALTNVSSTKTTTQAVFGAVDQRLNQYFRTTGITRD